MPVGAMEVLADADDDGGAGIESHGAPYESPPPAITTVRNLARSGPDPEADAGLEAIGVTAGRSALTFRQPHRGPSGVPSYTPTR